MVELRRGCSAMLDDLPSSTLDDIPEWVDNTPLRFIKLLLEPSRFSSIVGQLAADGLPACLESQLCTVVAAPISPCLFSEHLMVLQDGPATPMIVVDDTVVSFLGHSYIPDDRTSSHVEFVILTCTPPRDLYSAEKAGGGGCEAHIVQRRFSDFVCLHALLLPRARRAGLALPALPAKTWLRDLSAAFQLRRQVALQRWLAWVVHHQLWCDALCLFLGVGELEAARAITLPVVSQGVATDGGVLKSPQLLHKPSPADSVDTVCDVDTSDTSTHSSEYSEAEALSEAPTRPSSAMAHAMVMPMVPSSTPPCDAACVDGTLSSSPLSSAGYLTAQEDYDSEGS